MPCDTRLKPRQTISQRAEEVRRAVGTLDKLLAAGTAKMIVGPTGGVTFTGWPENERDGITDACAYRRIVATGSVSAKMALMRAEQMQGRTVNRQSLAHGHHSHDGGHTWHDHKG